MQKLGTVFWYWKAEISSFPKNFVQMMCSYLL